MISLSKFQIHTDFELLLYMKMRAVGESGHRRKWPIVGVNRGSVNGGVRTGINWRAIGGK